MSTSAWYEYNSKDDTPDLNDPCYNPHCKCKKEITFTSYQLQVEGAGFRNTSKEVKKHGNQFLSHYLTL